MIKNLNWFVLALFLLASCSNQDKEKNEDSSVVVADTVVLIENFIYGLWSLDSGQQLYNEGYYFQPDGIVDLVSSEVRGNWKLLESNQIELELPTYDYSPVKFSFHIDSISDGRMILSDSPGKHVFRKVPFGMNSEGALLSGFMGSLTTKMPERDYSVKLPAVKRINISLESADSSLVFTLWDQEKELSSAKLRQWDGIIIRGGDYRIHVEHLHPARLSSKDAEYNVKVLNY